MGKLTKKQLKFLILIIASLVLVFNIALGLLLINKPQSSSSISQIEQKKEKYYSYKGEDGKNAYEILEKGAEIETDNSGLIITINTLKVNPSKEYWAFYTNGKLSNVGPKEYQTKNEELIEWKVEEF